MFILPNEASYKAYLLLNAQSMSPQAQNALLKVLEEPPAYAVFLLACDSKTKMLPTILSRVTTFTRIRPRRSSRPPQAKRSRRQTTFLTRWRGRLPLLLNSHYSP